MKKISRFLAILLVAAMVASFSSALALDKYQYTKYKQYLCIGDSVAAGYTYSGSWDNYGFTRVRGAYHDIVANAVDADLLQYATSGFRLIELRYMMDGKATDPDDFWKQCFGSSYMSPEVLDGYTEQFREGFRTSDLASINLGSNDILTASAMKFIFAMNSAGASEESKNTLIKQVQDYLNTIAEKNASFADLLKLARTARDMPGVLRDLITNIFTLYNLYKENWEATMKVIYTELNPDITMEVLSVYNPAFKIFIDENRSINLGPIVQPVINMINHFMQYESAYHNKYVFVNVDGVDTWGMTMADPDYFTYFVWSMHPTRLGHTDIATRMLKVMPEHWVDIKLTEQPKDVTVREGEEASFTLD
ncbi:MAG: hypothetical protein IJI27_00830, partial [Oscillospiraceae bacterium]|nr:hypothetical protein [Oscillospiraceae bacterium]